MKHPLTKRGMGTPVFQTNPLKSDCFFSDLAEPATLGMLIAALEQANSSAKVWFSTEGNSYSELIGEFHSWRGVYADLSLSPDNDSPGKGTPGTVAELLREARACVGKEFTGYKGGEFLMGLETPVWADSYGHCSGWAITGISYDETLAALLLHRSKVDTF